jgi:hypothetical protein
MFSLSSFGKTIGDNQGKKKPKNKPYARKKAVIIFKIL